LTQKHDIIDVPIFVPYYFFGKGFTNVLSHTLSEPMDTRTSGRRFERFEQVVICQIEAFIHSTRLDLHLYYWRTNHGAE